MPATIHLKKGEERTYAYIELIDLIFFQLLLSEMKRLSKEEKQETHVMKVWICYSQLLGKVCLDPLY